MDFSSRCLGRVFFRKWLGLGEACVSSRYSMLSGIFGATLRLLIALLILFLEINKAVHCLARRSVGVWLGRNQCCFLTYWYQIDLLYLCNKLENKLIFLHFGLSYWVFFYHDEKISTHKKKGWNKSTHTKWKTSHNLT